MNMKINSKKANVTWNFFTELFHKTCQYFLNTQVTKWDIIHISILPLFRKNSSISKSRNDKANTRVDRCLYRIKIYLVT